MDSSDQNSKRRLVLPRILSAKYDGFQLATPSAFMYVSKMLSIPVIMVSYIGEELDGRVCGILNAMLELEKSIGGNICIMTVLFLLRDKNVCLVKCMG